MSDERLPSMVDDDRRATVEGGTSEMDPVAEMTMVPDSSWPPKPIVAHVDEAKEPDLVEAWRAVVACAIATVIASAVNALIYLVVDRIIDSASRPLNKWPSILLLCVTFLSVPVEAGILSVKFWSDNATTGWQRFKRLLASAFFICLLLSVVMLGNDVPYFIVGAVIVVGFVGFVSLAFVGIIIGDVLFKPSLAASTQIPDDKPSDPILSTVSLPDHRE